MNILYTVLIIFGVIAAIIILVTLVNLILDNNEKKSNKEPDVEESNKKSNPESNSTPDLNKRTISPASIPSRPLYEVKTGNYGSWV
jgi:cytoskeletal protein RodZ